MHNQNLKWDCMKPSLGEKYESTKHLKNCLINYGLANGHKIVFEKLTSKKLLARCGQKGKNKGCPWRLWASNMNEDVTIQVKSMEDEHRCCRNFNLGSMITSSWIAKTYEIRIKQQPDIKVSDLQASILETYKCRVSTGVCYRAKAKVLALFEVGLIEHYGRLWDYAQEIRSSNPGTTVLMETNPMPDGVNYFSRFYVCFKGLKDAWLIGCRRVLGLDGCFLKSTCKGELLAAVVKASYWKASKATYPQKFEEAMTEIRTLDNEAYQYLMKTNPKSWSRAFFTTGRACEAVENGISECFNSLIRDARRKPIITMLEEIRVCLKLRLNEMKKKAANWNDQICPTIRKKLEVQKELHRFWFVVPCGDGKYEVKHGIEAYKVDETNRTCSCRLWELSGIPCQHAVAAILFLNHDPDVYVSEWYKLPMLKETYSYHMLPVHGSNMWDKMPYTKPMPPLARRMPGRPPVKRKRDAFEANPSKVSQKGRKVRCLKCNRTGHNVRSCQSPEIADPGRRRKRGGRGRGDEGTNANSRTSKNAHLKSRRGEKSYVLGMGVTYDNETGAAMLGSSNGVPLPAWPPNKPLPSATEANKSKRFVLGNQESQVCGEKASQVSKALMKVKKNHTVTKSLT